MIRRLLDWLDGTRRVLAALADGDDWTDLELERGLGWDPRFALLRAECAEFVTARDEYPPEPGGLPAPRIYRITPKGLRYLTGGAR